METDQMLDPRKLRWPFVVFGVITFGIGVFFVVEPHETLKVFTVIAGIFLLVDGALALIGAIVGIRESRGVLAMLGILSIIAGLVLIKKPFGTLVVFTLIVGVWFVVAGATRLVSSFSMAGSRGPTLFSATVDLVAGIVILAWPELSLATFAVIYGIVLIVRGILFIYAGIAVGRLDGLSGGEPGTPALA
jgi:uncharacterized membrane protein HdeD (DUF308 family)